MMNRKTFIKNSSIAAVLPFFLDAFWACNTKAANPNRIFVLIQLVGGNDGLNTLIPLNDYKNFTAARPNLFIPESKILTLKGQSATGLHPALSGIKDLFDHDVVSFVQGVGYENQNYSHFRSQDIWLSGASSSKVLYTGWMARFLETRYKNYPEGFPNAQHTEPPAIKVGDNGTFLFEGSAMDMSIVIDPNAAEFETGKTETAEGESTGFAAQQVKSIREMMLQTERYSQVIKKALGTQFQHSKLYPKTGENPLADQLKTVAQLIYSGMQTSVYHVDLKGFDTHAAQVDGADTTKGAHADLLKNLGQALTCFWDDITRMNRQNDVAGMTFSEFGRRIKSNAANGTDHGAAQPLLFFGAGVNPGITGHNPEIPAMVTGSDNLAMQYDFRAVYAAILKHRFSADDVLIKDILQGSFADPGIFKS